MEILEEFQQKFRVKEYSIFESRYWVWSLRPVQSTIGSGILSLKRECMVFSELTKDEFSDLNNIIKVIEPTIKKTFNYNKINYLMLMMVDKHIHYHVIPRYAKELEFFGKLWLDNGWPNLPILNGNPSSNEKLKSIIQYLKENLSG